MLSGRSLRTASFPSLLPAGESHLLSRRRPAGLLRLSRLRERRTRSQSAAGEGFHLWGISSARLDGPIAETTLTPTLPRKRGREATVRVATGRAM